MKKVCNNPRTWVYITTLCILLTAVAFTYTNALTGILGLYATALCYLNLKLSRL
jgi:hypothetical protein